jgi:hypothetical protein
VTDRTASGAQQGREGQDRGEGGGGGEGGLEEEAGCVARVLGIFTDHGAPIL